MQGIRGFMEEYKQYIIQKWLEHMKQKNPGIYGSAFAFMALQQLVDVLFDLDTPLETHPKYNIIPDICAFNIKNKIPVFGVFESFYFLKELILDCFWDYVIRNDLPRDEAFNYVRLLIFRIEKILGIASNLYSENVEEKLYTKEEQIKQLHLDRLSLLGKMAASMAHELRNPLTVIHSFLKLVQNETAGIGLHRVNRYLDTIEDEFKIVFGQITAFLSFSKNEGIEEPFSKCSIDELIHSVISLVFPRLNVENIDHHIRNKTRSHISIQKTSVKQVLTNLINNSIEALIEIDYPKIINIFSYEDAKNVYIEIQDNGIGIPDDVKDQIFTPFITNKPNGTGLGLSICKQIMNKNGGGITFTSIPGRTTFTLSFLK